jgi:hypothetical protein
VVWQGSAGDRRPYADQQPIASRIGWACEGALACHQLTGHAEQGRLNGGHMMRKTEREPDAVNLLNGFEERRFLKRPEFRRRSS